MKKLIFCSIFILCSWAMNGQTVNAVIAKIYVDMADQTVSHNYAEINDLMYLFRGSAKKTPVEVRIFLEHAHRIIN
jgi:hypothetical protein